MPLQMQVVRLLFSVTVSGAIDGISRRYPSRDDFRLAAKIRIRSVRRYRGYDFYPDDVTDLGDDRYLLTMSHALPMGLAFTDARLNLFELCDGAMNGTLFETDSDGDATVDAFDLFPNDAAEYQDSDGDGIGNSADPDGDNDGVEDALDAFPTDPAESVDSDSDGIGNVADTDDDNDGVLDANDAFPLDADEVLDTDGDGIGNNADTDDDNDGLPDVVELTLIHIAGDGLQTFSSWAYDCWCRR